MAQVLRQLLPELVILSPFALESHHPLDALAGVLAQAEVVATARYQTTVLRLLSGRMAFSLHSSPKAEDLAQRLSLPGVSLGRLDPATVVAAMEASASKNFDPQPLRRAVRSHFARQMVRAGTNARPLGEDLWPPQRPTGAADLSARPSRPLH